MRFISFGSGSNGNCYYLFNERTGILIDAGIGIRTLRKRFMEKGFSMGNIRCLLLTHEHIDHSRCAGLLSEQYNIDVFATNKVHSAMDNMSWLPHKIPPEKKHIIETGKPFYLGNIEVYAFAVPHDSVECVGYELLFDGLRFAIITDVGHITEDIRNIVHRADYLVIESNHDEKMLSTGSYPYPLQERIRGGHGHLSNAECGALLRDNAHRHLRHVWLCHLSKENNTPELALATVRQYMEEGGFDVGGALKVDSLFRGEMSQVWTL